MASLASVPKQVIIGKPAGWTQKAAKELLPPSATISLHKVGGARWTIKANYFGGLGEKMKAFGGGNVVTQFAALVQVLRLAWTAYDALKGFPCPYELDTASTPGVSSAAAAAL